MLLCGDADNVYALCANTGVQIWEHPVSVTPGTTVAVDDTEVGSNPVVWVGSSDGTLHVLDAGNGRLRFKYATGGAVGTPAITSDGLAVVGSTDGWLYAFQPLGWSGKAVHHSTGSAEEFGPMDGPVTRRFKYHGGGFANARAPTSGGYGSAMRSFWGALLRNTHTAWNRLAAAWSRGHVDISV
jgi:hypothetical protein